MKIDVQGKNYVKQAWESLNTQIGLNISFSLDERTMGSRDLVKELSQINLDAQNTQNITHGTLLHFQKMSNLCVYFATLSALRHEIKNLVGNSTSKGSNDLKYLISIPNGKSIDELFKEKKINGRPNVLSFERMLSVLLGCVSLRALSGKGQNFKVVF